MGSIADLYASVRADMSEFSNELQVGLQKEADKGGKTFSDAFSKRMRAAAAVAGTAMAAGFAVMTKGAMEGERVMGEFQAATGKSAEAAKAFAHDMNGLVGTNETVGRSFEDIAAAGTKVVQQFGLEGQAAKDLTSDFLAFAKVTGQGADVVDDFDAALDAWGEPAERASSLMDQLIASNQKYGTDAGPGATKALQEMAPALLAMNMNLDDGVALLNLFEANGIDATKAVAPLNRAVKDLEPGQGLDDLVAQITSIPDPAARAQRAIEIFGSRGGVGLANALKPGLNGLSEMGITAEEASGKAEAASDAMVTTTDRVRMFFDGALARLRGVGLELGPIVTGIASMTSLAGPAIAALWGRIGSSAVITGAASAAGAVGGAAYTAGAFVVSKFMGAASLMWGALKGPQMLGMLKGIGGAWGGAIGLGVAGVLATIIIAELGELARIAGENREVAAALDATMAQNIKQGLTREAAQEQLDALRAIHDEAGAIQQGLMAAGDIGEGNIIGSGFDLLFGSNPAEARNKQIRELEAHIAAIDALGEQGGQKVGESFTTGMSGAIASGGGAVETAGEQTGMSLATGLQQGFGGAVASIRTSLDAIVATVPAWKRLDAAISGLATGGLRELRGEAKDADKEWRQLIRTGDRNKVAIKELNDEIDKWERRYRRAIKNNDSEAAAFASAQLTRLTGERDQRQVVVDKVKEQHRALNALPEKTTTTVVANVNDGQLDTLEARLATMSQGYRDFNINLRGTAGTTPGGGRAFGGPVRAGVPYIVGERRPEVFVPETNGRVEPDTRSLGGTTVNLDVHGLPMQAKTPLEVVQQIRRAARLGMLQPRPARGWG